MQAKKDGSFTPKNIKEESEASMDLMMRRGGGSSGSSKNRKRIDQHDPIWNVKEGETFPSYNARIKASGLSKPPGVPQTYRRGEESLAARNAAAGDGGDGDGLKMKRRIVDTTITDQDVQDGLKTKRRRKEFMKNRGKKANLADSDHRSDSHSTNVEDLRTRKTVFRDVVHAPPNIKIKPKNNLKAPVRKISYDPSVTLNRMGRPSLLPLVNKK